MTEPSNRSISRRIWGRVRSVVFCSAISLATLLYCLLLPALLLPRACVLRIVRSYLALLFWLTRHLYGLHWRIRGDWREACHPVLVAAKHQSAFETLILQYLLGDPAIVLKRELFSVPILGWTLKRLGHIGVDRSGSLEGIHQFLLEARKAHQKGRPLLIFPEGSRRTVGAQPDYKSGVKLLYAILKAPCIPVALNSGRVWPGKSFLPRHGRVVVEFLTPIEGGLSRSVFGERLEREIEEATERLMLEPL